MKLVIIAQAHPESTLPLAKYIAQFGIEVDYYFITSIGQRSTSAFSFGITAKLPGIKKLTRKHISAIYNYMQSDNVSINLIILPRPFARIKTKLFRFVVDSTISFLIGRICYHVKNQKADFINIVGQADILIKFHEKLGQSNICHSLHEVVDHFTREFTKPSQLLLYLAKFNIPIIVHSKSTFEDLILYNFINKSNVFLIPFGLFETYSIIKPESNFDFGDNYLLFFGYISPYKGLSFLYEAVELCKYKIPDIKVVIAGAGSDPILQKMREDETYIVHNSFLTNEELVKINMNARAIICPYLSSSQSGIVQTAFIFDKPVIATKVGAFSEILVDNFNGFLVSPRNPIELSSAITKIYNNSILNMLKEGIHKFKSIESEHSWEVIGKKYVELFSRKKNEDNVNY